MYKQILTFFNSLLLKYLTNLVLIKMLLFLVDYYLLIMKTELKHHSQFPPVILYLTLLPLPPLRVHCVGGCWDRTQDFDFGMWQSDATTRLDLIPKIGYRPHPQLG
jgi:hypothetical protein